MTAPLSDAELQRGLAVLRFKEGSDWLFPDGMTAAEEERRIYRAQELLAIEFGRCEARPTLIGEDTYTFSPQSGPLVAGPRRGKGVSLGVLLCTFGIATAWPGRQPSMLAQAIARRIIGPPVVPRWVPGWWDQASTEVEQALIRAAGCLAEAGYEYVPDPVFDEPYDGRFAQAAPRPAYNPDWLNPKMRWALRYFELDARSGDGGTASHTPSG